MGAKRRRARKKRAAGRDPAKASLRAFGQRNLPLALKRIDEALTRDVNNQNHLVLRGNVLQEMRRIEEAESCYLHALAIDEECADAHYDLGNIRRYKGDVEGAARSFERAIAIRPEHGEAHNNLGIIYLEMGRFEEAASCFEQATSLRPRWGKAHANLGTAYRELWRYEEAERCLQRALAVDPAVAPKVYSALGSLRGGQWRMEEALACYQKAVRAALPRGGTGDNGTALDPDCGWCHGNLLLHMHYNPDCDAESIWKESQCWAAAHASPLAHHLRPHANFADPERRLRIGYVSADLRQHSVAYFLEPVLARHDRQQVETFIYSEVRRPDATTERLMPLADHWSSTVGLSDEQLAERIRADGIDILVDLAGHTSQNRLLVFAREPAPVQVTWLGYADTTGMEVMDYRLTDEWADPPGKTDHLHSEELVRLPGGFSCYQPPADAPEIERLPALGAGRVTFGSLNNLLKVSTATVEAWAAILRGVPEAQLLLKGKPFKNEATKQRITEEFARHGVSHDRLILLPYVSSVSSHLEVYAQVDLALDTYPYHGTTTTCEAVWMGVPVVTLAGRPHASRTGVSLLTQLGLEEFIADSPERYVELAIEKARDLEGLERLRVGLRERMANSSLMDWSGFTRKLETAYREMWRRWCEKQQPQDDESISAEASLRAFQQGDLALALKLIDEALARDAMIPLYHVMRGNIVQQMGRLEESTSCYLRALAIDDQCADAHYNLGNTRNRQGRFDDAARCFEQAVAIQPGNGEAQNNLGNVYRKMGRLQEAVPCFEQAVALRPGWGAPQLNLGNAYRELFRHKEAADCMERAIELEPALAPIGYSNLGIVRGQQWRMQEALACYQKAVRAAVPPGGGRGNNPPLGPDSASCHSNLLLQMHYGPDSDAENIWKESQRWAAIHATPLARHLRRHANSSDPERRLCVGYISANLRQHPVAYFLEPVLARHDRRQVETFIYCGVQRPDEVTKRLMPLADHWFSTVGLSDEQMVTQIRADAIDILVDLAGHAGQNHLLVFARKPAPVQVTWLGYPGTTGMEVMDYRLTDEWADPPGKTDHLHSEELVRLPGGFSCYQPPDDAPEVGRLPALEAGHVTFGSLNNLLKVSMVTVEAWAGILRGAPNAQLLLKAKEFQNEATRQRITEEFARHGVSPDRLILLPYLPSVSSHLEVYGQIDLALDTYPYHGTTTTCEALWMGVPVVTLAGRTHASRAGVSLLTQLGFEEFIADSPERYVELAVERARDLEGLRRLRAGLRERMANSSLMDSSAFTRKIETAYRQMWRRWCEKQQPQDDECKGVTVSVQQQGVSKNVMPGDRSRGTEEEAEALGRRVAGFPYWYHRIELPGGVVTPGWAPLSPKTYRIPGDLRGKRVLDVGAWDGYWSFEALKRGARQVVAIDDFSDYLGALEAKDRRAWETFDLCREALGYSSDQCQRHEMSIYEATPQRLGSFDVVFCFGLLYHLRYPLLALDGLASMCEEEIFIESAILDDYSAYRGGLGKGYGGGHVVAEFYPGAQYGGNPTNWWTPTLHCLGALVEAAGFPDIEAWKLTDEPTQLPHCRGFAHGRKNTKR